MTAALPKTLGSTLHSCCSPEFNAFTEFLLKILWWNSCRVEVRDLKLNHAVECTAKMSQWVCWRLDTEIASSNFLKSRFSSVLDAWSCRFQPEKSFINGRQPLKQPVIPAWLGSIQATVGCEQWPIYILIASHLPNRFQFRNPMWLKGISKSDVKSLAMIEILCCSQHFCHKSPVCWLARPKNWQCQPALLLHWYGNTPAAPMILQKFSCLFGG